MMSRNHMIVAGSAAVASTAVCGLNTQSSVSDWRAIHEWIFQYFYPVVLSGEFSWNLLNWWPVYLFVGLILLMFGSLLPDIDSKSSVLGRFLYVPVQHRTWTHSVWFVIPLLLLGIIHPVLRFIWVGCLLHILADEFSRGGVCFLYPVHTYKRYDSGAFVARGHKVKLYHTGQKSEIICVVCFVVISFLVCILARSGLVVFWRWITM